MKNLTVYGLIALFLLLPGFTHAQKHRKNKKKIVSYKYKDETPPRTVFFQNPDSLPSEYLYGPEWDTLYVRLNCHPKLKINDTLRLPLLSETSPRFYMPVPGKVISEFGIRHGRMHTGTDIALNKDDSVHCAFDGIVRMSRYFSGYGNIVVVRHFNGTETCYAHLSKRLAFVNQQVKAGEVVGLGGRTGRATCYHLHFELRYLEEAINSRVLIDYANQKLNSDTLILTASTFNSRAKSKKTPGKSKVQNNEITAGYYVIQSGDTLYSIAKRNGTTVQVLCDKNNLKSNAILRIGQKLKL